MRKKKQGATLEELARPRRMSQHDYEQKQCKVKMKSKGFPANKKRDYPQASESAKYFESLLEDALDIYLD